MFQYFMALYRLLIIIVIITVIVIVIIIICLTLGGSINVALKVYTVLNECG